MGIKGVNEKILYFYITKYMLQPHLDIITVMLNIYFASFVTFLREVYLLLNLSYIKP